jgi:hypothetical protein
MQFRSSINFETQSRLHQKIHPDCEVDDEVNLQKMREKSLNSDGEQFYHYQQNEQILKYLELF